MTPNNNRKGGSMTSAHGNFNLLVEALKEGGQDYEFYPTTKEIVAAVYNDMGSKGYNDRPRYSVLDIGCGNGGFFTKFDAIRAEARAHNLALGLSDYEETPDYGLRARMRPKAFIDDRYGIEKSDILIGALPDNVVVVGADFWHNTLIDKKVDVIFSNPPYSEFKTWSVKIILEAYAQTIYLVLPERWQDSEIIQDALKRRKFRAMVLGSFDFLDAERAARAKVEVIKITREGSENYYSRRGNENDPFDIWFISEFGIDAKEKEKDESYSQQREREEAFSRGVKAEVVRGRNLVQVLEQLYQNEMAEMQGAYKKICAIDAELLKELGVAKDKIRDGLKEKIKNTKAKYWHELFDNLAEITTRLTSAKRKELLGTLHKNMHVDFTEANAFAIVIWVIKNANKYFDEQLKEMFLRLSEPEYIKNYKSNQRTWKNDGWRYKKGDHDRYTLDYRIITADYKGYRDESDLVRDIKTIANNLGFNYIGDVKSFKNNNVHFRFEKGFMKAFNIEAARLFGWVRDAGDIIREFSDECEIEPEDIALAFKSNHAITAKPSQFLLTHQDCETA